MPFLVALFEAGTFVLVGAAVTLISVFFSRAVYAFAWRMWLGGSIGLIAGNLALAAILSPFLVGIGIAADGPHFAHVRDAFLTELILLSPLLITTLGIALGCVYGRKRARRALGI